MFNRLFWGALALAFMTPIGLALAAAVSDTVAVTTPAAASIPIGDWITQILTWGRDAAVMLIFGLGTIFCRQLPAQAGAALMSIWTEKMVGHAIDYAFAAIENATKGQVLTLPMANAVIAQAEQYAIANAPLMIRLLGNTLRPKIVARLSALGALPPGANAANLGTARAVRTVAAPAVVQAHWLATLGALALVAFLAACDLSAFSGAVTTLRAVAVKIDAIAANAVTAASQGIALVQADLPMACSLASTAASLGKTAVTAGAARTLSASDQAAVTSALNGLSAVSQTDACVSASKGVVVSNAPQALAGIVQAFTTVRSAVRTAPVPATASAAATASGA